MSDFCSCDVCLCMCVCAFHCPELINWLFTLSINLVFVISCPFFDTCCYIHKTWHWLSKMFSHFLTKTQPDTHTDYARLNNRQQCTIQTSCSFLFSCSSLAPCSVLCSQVLTNDLSCCKLSFNIDMGELVWIMFNRIEWRCGTALLRSILPLLKWNSHQKATKALFGIEYESDLCVKAQLRQKRHF